MAATVHCVRCGRPEAPALPRMPVPGKLGQEIREKVCADCWADWQRVEVMVINELRLNFMDPGAQETLNQHMREFLFTPQTGSTETEAATHEEH
jgi:Fe-S cluster biosynthesis and repair protein YggX